MTVFDLTDIKSEDATNHNKLVNSPELVQLIGKRLATGQTPLELRLAGVAAANALPESASRETKTCGLRLSAQRTYN